MNREIEKYFHKKNSLYATPYYKSKKSVVL